MSGKIGDNSLSTELLEKTVKECEILIEKRKAVNEEIKAILETAEAQGLDKKTIRDMIRLREKDLEERREQENLRDLYKMALGLDD